ncbi:MAG: DUF2520 domain-containing protein [Bacillota bacterium]|nr:DUF2520 domain-containing protein [Bacillota bacterium]
MNIGFIGAGKVGCSLGKLLSTRGMKVSGYYDRDTKFAEEAAQFTNSKAFAEPSALISESDVLFITVPDGLITTVYEGIRTLPIEGKYICHCSGSISSRDAFPDIGSTGAYEYSVHPLFAVSDRFETYPELADAFFTLEGDPSHIDDMADLLKQCGLRFQIIDPSSKTRYHLAAVYASNLTLALISNGISLLQECGFTADDALAALSPLVSGNIAHALANGPAKALTGPVERGDITTLGKHLSVTPDEDDRQLYTLLSAKLLPLAKAKNPDRDYSDLEHYLNEMKGKRK